MKWIGDQTKAALLKNDEEEIGPFSKNGPGRGGVR
jgi:hypothetical protein